MNEQKKTIQIKMLVLQILKSLIPSTFLRKKLLIVIFATIFFPSFAFAQEPIGTDLNLTVTPQVSYLHVPPGSTTNHTIILENTGTSSITVMPSLVDFTTNGKNGQVILTNQLTFPYISFGEDNSVKEVTIPAGKKAQLTLHINVPKDAEEKEYPMSVLFFSKYDIERSRHITNTNSQISAAIGSNLIVLVAKQNTFTKVFKIEHIYAPILIDSFQKITFSPLVKNNSLGAAQASGSAKILDWRKQTVAEFTIYPDTVLGHNSRELRSLLSNKDIEKPEVGVFTFKPKFMIGPYQIIISLTNENNEIITQEIHVFYALPISILLVTIIGFLIYFYFAKAKNYKLTSL